MRVTINLATQPYQDVRAFALRWGLVLVLLAALAGLLVVRAVQGWRSTQDISAVITADNAHISKLQSDVATAKQVLDRPANQNIRMQSAFLNTLIARKAFSWTQAFSTLEKLMPPRLHVVSMQPQLDDQNRLELKMTLAGDSHEKVVDLLRRMETSPHFQQPQLVAEQQGRQGQLEFQVQSFYVPELPQNTNGEKTSAAVRPPAASGIKKTPAPGASPYDSTGRPKPITLGASPHDSTNGTKPIALDASPYGSSSRTKPIALRVSPGGL